MTSQDDIFDRLKAITDNADREKAISLTLSMLKDEYNRLADVMIGVRERYLSFNIEDTALQNDIADLRLEAVDAYKPVNLIEAFLMERYDVNPESIMPAYDGDFPVSKAGEKGLELSFVTLKESAMRTLGLHCNVIGDMILLERRLYHHTYLAAAMKPAGESNIVFDFLTVVFDEDVIS
jgi:hypothetical protein